MIKFHCILISDDEEIKDSDSNHAFEHIRQLLLDQKITEAVTYLWKVCTKLEGGPKIEDFTINKKKECLFTFLRKIFIESENELSDTEKDEDVNNAEKSEEDIKKEEEMNKRKNVINYLKVT